MYQNKIMKKHREIKETDIRQKYIDENMSAIEVAKEFEISARRVAYLIQKYHIKKDMKSRLEVVKRNNLKKYGTSCTLCVDEVNAKSRKTCLEKYGVEYPTQNKEIYSKVISTNLSRYGVKCTSQVREIRNKQKATYIERCGYENPLQNPEVLKKISDTKRKNKTFVSSNPEKIILEKLHSKFKEVFIQYRSDKYPFDCDFYIKDLNLYIEYQGYWNHNRHPFTGNKEDCEILNRWKQKAKTNPAYITAIDVWTKRDPLKRKTAKENNLNWLEFFTMKSFEDWFNLQKID